MEINRFSNPVKRLLQSALKKRKGMYFHAITMKVQTDVKRKKCITTTSYIPLMFITICSSVVETD